MTLIRCICYCTIYDVGLVTPKQSRRVFADFVRKICIDFVLMIKSSLMLPTVLILIKKVYWKRKEPTKDKVNCSLESTQLYIYLFIYL